MTKAEKTDRQAERLEKYEHLTGLKKTFAAEMVARNITEAALARAIGAEQTRLHMWLKSENSYGGLDLADKLIAYFDFKLVRIL